MALVCPLRSAQALTLETVSYVSGDYMRHAAARGDYLFRTTQDAMAGGKLLIHDLSDPSHPRLAAALDLGHFAYSLAVSEKLAVAGGWGLRLVGISDPAAPVDYGESMLSRNPYGLGLIGDTLYVADLNEGLLVVDISNPAAPSVLGGLGIGSGVVGLAVDPPYALLLDWYDRVHVVNVANPAAPTKVGVWQSPIEVTAMAVRGAYGYVVGDEQLRVINLSTWPPVEHPAYRFDRQAYDLALAGCYAFVALSYPDAVVALDVSEPASPILAAYLPVDWQGRDLAASDSQAVLIGGEGQVLGIDADTLTESYEIPRMRVPVYGFQVAASSGYAYVTSGWGSSPGGELSVINTTTPEAPVKAAALPSDASPTWVVAAGGLLYVSLDGISPSLAIYDIADPARPVNIGGLTWASGAGQHLAIRGHYAYVCTEYELRVFDISTPTSAAQVGSFGPLPNKGMAVAVSGNHAFVAAGRAGLQVIDVSDPQHPELAGSLSLPGDASGIAVAGRFALVATGDPGVRAIDISRPASPVEVMSFDVPATGVTIHGSYLYTDAGLIGLCGLAGAGAEGGEGVSSSSYAFQDGYVLRAAGSAGLVVLKAVTAFSDTPLDHWALDAIERCAAWGIVAGYPDGGYHPSEAVTREQMAVYTSRAIAGGDAEVPSGPSTAHFPDVPASHWAFRYVEYAYQEGVVTGYPDALYRPTEAVDRAQMAVFISRAMAGGESAVPDPGCDAPVFPDVPCDFWARRYVQFIKSVGVAGGYPDGNYRPDALCTRDQMAAFVARGFHLPM